MPGTAPSIPGFAVNRPHRADARRNFDALLDAARGAFALEGIEVPLEDIARDAGVGIGTLYRNFPARQDLFEAVYVGEIEDLCQAAYDVADQEPWEAFEAWLRRFAGYVTTKLALLQALNKESEMFRACRGAMQDAAGPLYERAQAAGAIRDDVGLDDVLRMVSGIIASTYADDEQRERVFNLALDAIRATPPV
jgi:AcrR family transcriptional regulator